MMFPNAEVFGYDISDEAVELAQRLIDENGLTSTTVTVRDVKPDFWDTFPSEKRTLIICDIEGAELELFDESAARKLAHADLIIELHDFLDGRIKPALLQAFEATHVLEIARESSPNTSKYSSLQNLPLRECELLLDEGRPCKMEWLVARSKSGQSDG